MQEPMFRDPCLLMVLDCIYRDGPMQTASLVRRIVHASAAHAFRTDQVMHTIRGATERGELIRGEFGLRLSPKGLQSLIAQRGYWRALLPAVRRAIA